MDRRGLTLLEVLIVIGLLMAMLALAFPSLHSLLARQQFEWTVQAIQEQLLLARAHAQMTGRPVEVLHQAEANRTAVRFFVSFSETASAARDERIVEPWAILELPRGVSVGREAPDSMVEGAMGSILVSTRANRGKFSDSWEDSSERRLVVLMPDGTALLSTEMWIFDGDGRIGRLIINPWSGGARFVAGSEAETVNVEEIEDDSPSRAVMEGRDPSAALADAAGPTSRDAGRGGR